MSITNWADIELRRGKAQYLEKEVWGRRVIQAIDVDDCIELSKLLDTKDPKNKSIDTQTNVLGYCEYLWTAAIHRHLGDTALHYAVKERKILCIHMLLYLGADALIANEEDITPADLCLSIYKTDYKNMKYDAGRFIIRHLSPLRLSDLPPKFLCQDIEKEAWSLIHHGRILYHELPKALQVKTIDAHVVSMRNRRRLSFNMETGEEREAQGEEKRESVNYSSKSKSFMSKPSLQEIARSVKNMQPWMDYTPPVPAPPTSPEAMAGAGGRERGSPKEKKKKEEKVQEIFQPESSVEGGSSVLSGGSFESSTGPPASVSPSPSPQPLIPRTFSLDSDERLSEANSSVLGPSEKKIAAAWEKTYTEEGEEYFFNPLTGETQWLPPDGYVDPNPPKDEGEESVASIQPSVSYFYPPHSAPSLPIEDVWTKNTLSDILSLLRRQNRIRRGEEGGEDEEEEGEDYIPPVFFPMGGGAGRGQALERLSLQESALKEGDRGALSLLLEEKEREKEGERGEGEEGLSALLQSKGVQKLKFLSPSSLQQTLLSLRRGESAEQEGAEESQRYERSERRVEKGKSSRRYLLSPAHLFSDKILLQDTPSARPPSSSRSFPLLPLSPFVESLLRPYSFSSQKNTPSYSSPLSSPQRGSSKLPLSSSSPSGRFQLYRGGSASSLRGLSRKDRGGSSREAERGRVFSSKLSPSLLDRGSGERDEEERGEERGESLPGFRYLSELSTYSSLKHLKIGDEGLVSLSQALTGDLCLSSLVLCNAHLSDRGVEALAVALPSMRVLERLDLSGNSIGDRGVEALSLSLLSLYNQANRPPEIKRAPKSQYIYLSSKKSMRFGGEEERRYRRVVTLRSLSLAGNKASLQSLLPLLSSLSLLVQSAPVHYLHYLSVHNNRGLGHAGREEGCALLRERGFEEEGEKDYPRISKRARIMRFERARGGIWEGAIKKESLGNFGDGNSSVGEMSNDQRSVEKEIDMLRCTVVL